MKGLKFDFERSASEAGGLPMYLALRGDLSDPANLPNIGDIDEALV